MLIAATLINLASLFLLFGVALTTAAGARRWFRVARDGSYASASDPRIVVGLGDGLGERDAGRVDVEVFRGGQSVLRLEGLEPILNEI